MSGHGQTEPIGEGRSETDLVWWLCESSSVG
jgi:hypothetical protein